MAEMSDELPVAEDVPDFQPKGATSSEVSHSTKPVDSILRYIVPTGQSEDFLSENPRAYRQTSTGKALIVNVSRHGDHGLREGSNKDRDNLKDLLKKTLKFEVSTYDNDDAKGDVKYNPLTSLDIQTLVRDFARNPDGDKCWCSVVCLMSHGNKDGIFGYDLNLVKIDDLLRYFDNNNPRLAGKPKIFILQACRGKLRDVGAKKPEREDEEEEYDEEEEDDYGVMSVGPSYTDILIAYPALEGYKASRLPEGSAFIQAVVDVFTKFAKKESLSQMMHRVNGIMADRQPGGSKKNYHMSIQGDTLTKEVYFYKQI